MNNNAHMLLLCIILITSRAVLSQQDTPYSASVSVQLLFSATARKGDPTLQLGPGDFTVLDNGRQQTSFSLNRAEDLPLALGVLEDGSLRNLANPMGALTLSEEEAIVSSFLKPWLREQDRSVWLKFAVDSPNFMSISDLSDRAGMQGVVSAGYSQSAGKDLLQAVDMYRGQLPTTQCRRSVIVIANGGTFLSRDMYKRVEEIALREKIVLHVIDAYASRPFYGRRGPGDEMLPKTNLPAQLSVLAASVRQTLADLAAATGGIYIQANGKDAMRNALSRLQEQLGNQYVITYHGSGAQVGNEFHSVRIKAAKGTLTIHAPSGYYIPRE